MSKLQISIHGRTTCRPGEQLTGRIEWSLDTPRDWLELRLLWHTEGKGTRDGSIVQTMRIKQPDLTGEREFSFTLPPGPYSYSGRHIAIFWGLELVCDGEAEADRVDIKFLPAGESRDSQKTRKGKRRRLRAPAASRRSVSWRPRRPLGSAIFAVIFASAFVTGIVLLYHDAFASRARAEAAAAWPRVQCRLLSAEYKSNGRRRFHRSWLEVRYQYQFQGRQFIGDTFGVRAVTGPEIRAMAEHLRQFPPQVCYVNPDDPAEAVLDVSPEIWDFEEWLVSTGITLLFLPLTIAAAFVCIRDFRAKYGSDLDDPALPLPKRAAPGPVELTQYFGPLTIATFAFAAFSFAIITGAGAVWFSGDYMAGKGGLVLCGAITATVICLLMLGFSIDLILTLINPPVVLNASSDSVPLGGELDIAWDIRGTKHRLRRLQLALEGNEETIHEDPKRNKMFEHTFATIPIIDTTGREEMLAGARSVTIPAGTMHSLKASYNRIVWWIRVRGEMEGRPDIDLLFPIVVLPAGMDANTSNEKPAGRRVESA